MSESGTASNQCYKCGYPFKTLADEYGTHPCPRCGYDPVPFEPDDEVYCCECGEPCEDCGCECEEETECRS